MFKINHAVLHVFDFVSCVNVFSEDELDLTNKNVKSYVMRIARHALGGMDNRRGEFFPDSGFAAELSAYFKGERDFVEPFRAGGPVHVRGSRPYGEPLVVRLARG